MKKTRLIFLTVLTVCLGFVASAQTCSISGQNDVCAGEVVTYYLSGGSGYIYNWSFTDPSDGLLLESSYQHCKVQWASPTGSPCTRTINLIASDGGGSTCTKPITIHANPGFAAISGPSNVLPNASYINELPAVQYTIPSLTCANSIQWSFPSGWSIISGGSTNTVIVQPAINSACDGQITVSLANVGTRSCGVSTTKAISRGALARGEITNLIQWQGPNNTLVICPDDELLVDAHETTFCGDPNSKLFVAFIISDASWQNISEYNKWLSVSDYNALGGLSALDIRAFLALYYPSITIDPNSYYKVKIAVSGGGAWNERTFTVQTTQNTAPAPMLPHTSVLNPGGTHPKDVRLSWAGLNVVDYEILFQYSDGSTFPHPGTTTIFSGCSFPTYWFSYLVYEDMFGLPDDYHFRFKVRECGCGEWSSWSPTVQMLKPGKPNDIEAVADDIKLVRVYPNPAGDMITVELNTATSSAAQLVIMDMTGKVIISQDGIEPGIKNEIDVSQLPSGLYMTIVTQGDEVLLKEKLSVVH